MSDLNKQIDRIIETLLVRPLNTPGAYAETNKLADAIKALISTAAREARQDIANLAKQRAKDDPEYQLDAFAEDLETYIAHLKEGVQE